MVDIHSHILPGVDDGAKSWEIAIEMCRMASRDGVKQIVATPHANHEYKYDRTSHEALAAKLQEQVPEIKVSLGCDFHLSYENIEDALVNPRRYTIGNTRYLLVEFSDYSIPRAMPDALSRLLFADLVPIITHPERNPILQKKKDLIRQFAEMGCVIQVTANSLTGFWGRGVRKYSEELLKEGLCHVLASDAHDTKRRVPILSEAKKTADKILGKGHGARLVEDNPQAIVADDLLPI